MNVGKLKYDGVEIPAGLDEAIERGLRRGERKRRVRGLSRLAAGTAAALCLMFGAANIAPVYAFAEDIPVLGDIVRVFRVGSGGEVTDGVELGADSHGRDVELNFTNGGETASAPHYTVRQLSAPRRLVITLSGVRGMDFEALSAELLASGAVEDVYRSMVLDDSRVEINVVLAEGWGCELSEYDNPGSLLLSFTSEEPEGGTVYYLRTEAMPRSEELGLLCEEYHSLGATQVKTAAGGYIVAIGEYASAGEAAAALEALGESPFRVASGDKNEVPEE